MIVGCVDAPVSIGLNSGIDSASVGETIFKERNYKEKSMKLISEYFTEFFEYFFR